MELDRLAAKPYVEYPMPPSWYPALVGGYWSALTGSVLCARHGHPVWMIIIALGALGVLGTFLRWYRQRRGTSPLMSSAPAEIRHAYVTNLAGVITCAAITAIAFVLAPWYVRLGVAFVLFTTLYWAYERRTYPRAVGRVRSRLG